VTFMKERVLEIRIFLASSGERNRSGSVFRVSCFAFRVSSFVFRASCFGNPVPGFVFQVPYSEFRDPY